MLQNAIRRLIDGTTDKISFNAVALPGILVHNSAQPGITSFTLERGRTSKYFCNKIGQLRSLATHDFNETSSAAPEAPLVAFSSLVPSCW